MEAEVAAAQKRRAKLAARAADTSDPDKAAAAARKLKEQVRVGQCARVSLLFNVLSYQI